VVPKDRLDHAQGRHDRLALAIGEVGEIGKLIQHALRAELAEVRPRAVIHDLGQGVAAGEERRRRVLADHPLHELVPHLAQGRMVDVKFESLRLGCGRLVDLTIRRTLEHPLTLVDSFQDGLLLHHGGVINHWRLVDRRIVIHEGALPNGFFAHMVHRHRFLRALAFRLRHSRASQGAESTGRAASARVSNEARRARTQGRKSPWASRPWLSPEANLLGSPSERDNRGLTGTEKAGRRGRRRGRTRPMIRRLSRSSEPRGPKAP
jgi:hypothetical protein